MGIAEVKYESIVESSKVILKIIEDRSDENLGLCTDDEIRKHMRELTGFRALVSKFLADVKEFKEHTVLYKLTDIKHGKIAELHGKISTEHEVYISALENEDQQRALYTLDKTVGESVKWPKFSGALQENFSTFKEKFELAAKLNK